MDNTKEFSIYDDFLTGHKLSCCIKIHLFIPFVVYELTSYMLSDIYLSTIWSFIVKYSKDFEREAEKSHWLRITLVQIKLFYVIKTK